MCRSIWSWDSFFFFFLWYRKTLLSNFLIFRIKKSRFPFSLIYFRFSQIQFDLLSPPLLKLFNPSSSSIFANRIRECSHRVSASMIIPRASDEVSNISRIHPPSLSLFRIQSNVAWRQTKRWCGMKILRSRGYVRAICKSRLWKFRRTAPAWITAWNY